LLHWRPVLISGLRPFRRSCDLLTADESFDLTPDFIAAASHISLRIRQFLYQRSGQSFSRLVQPKNDLVTTHRRCTRCCADC
jgi:hypothetical protein